MEKSASNTKCFYIEIEMDNIDNIHSVAKKLNAVGIDIDITFIPRALSITKSNEQKLFLVKVKIVNSSIKQLNDCPDVINYWELKPFIPFNNDTGL